MVALLEDSASLRVPSRETLSRIYPTGSSIARSLCARQHSMAFEVRSRIRRGSRVVFSIVCDVETRTCLLPLCIRAEILGDAVDELLTLQLHLERLGRVRHNERIRRCSRLSQISRRNFRPLDVERIGGSSSGSLAHRG